MVLHMMVPNSKLKAMNVGFTVFRCERVRFSKFIPFSVMEELLKLIPETVGRESGYTLDRCSFDTLSRKSCKRIPVE